MDRITKYNDLTDQVEYNEYIINDRAKQLEKIRDDAARINEMMIALNVLIKEQTVPIKEMSENINNAKKDVGRGYVEVVKSETNVQMCIIC
jgi:methyl-accepting chemotaxis protein